MSILQAYEKMEKLKVEVPPVTQYYSVPPGTAHSEPCPDCGARLLLTVHGGRLQYRCEKEGCDGNAGADEHGKPLGLPINKWGRYKRWELHNLIDPYWNDPDGGYFLNNATRGAIYQYFALWLNVDEFHISLLNHQQLDKALHIAKTHFIRYMEFNGVEKKERLDDQIVQL